MIRFWKMHGAGNDFILVDDRDESFPSHNADMLTILCARRTGIGSDGLLLLQASTAADIRMRFFNPDGSEVDMCGNAARCVARLARHLGIVGDEMTIETAAGIHHAVCCDDGMVTLTLPAAAPVAYEELRLEGVPAPLHYGFVNTGVAHTVIRVDTLEHYPVTEQGAAIRHHPTFAPDGTNADFIVVHDRHTLSIRTYERGVEAETLACGTGVVASAVIAIDAGWVTAPVTVKTAGGDNLVVSDTPDGKLTLTGPAVFVYEGTIP